MCKRRFNVALLLLFLFGSVFSAFAEEGVTDREIHIASFGPLTGPAAAWGTVQKSLDAYFKMINDEGGISGRKIVFHQIDDGYNAAKTLMAVKELQEKVGIFAWVAGVGTANSLSVMDYFANRNIPWVSPLSGSEALVTPPKRNIFTMYPHNYLEGKALGRYAADVLYKERLAMVFQDDPYGWNGYKGVRDELFKFSKKMVGVIPIDKNNSDMEAIVEKLMAMDADAVFLWMPPASTFKILQIAKAKKFRPNWFASSAFADCQMMHELSKGLTRGMYVTNFGDLTETPLLVKYKDALKKYGEANDKWSIFYHAGFGFGELLVEGLKRSGRNLTRDKFIHEMEGVRDFKGVIAPISFAPFNPNSPKCRTGLNQVFVQQCRAFGTEKILTDWIGK